MYILHKIKYDVEIQNEPSQDNNWKIQCFPTEIVIRRLRPTSTPNNNSSCLLINYSINLEELKRNMFEFISTAENKDQLIDDVKESILKYFIEINSFFRKDATKQAGKAKIKNFDSTDNLIRFIESERKKTKKRIKLNFTNLNKEEFIKHGNK